METPNQVTLERPGIPNESEFDRARKFMERRRLEKVLATGGSIKTALDTVNSELKTLTDLADALTQKGNHTTAGISVELEKPKAQARVAVEKIKAQLDEQGRKIIEQARALDAESFPFDEDAKSELQLFLSLPPDRQQRIKAELITGKHASLARAILGAPEFSTAGIMTPQSRQLLKEKYTPQEAKNALLERARNHEVALGVVEDALKQIDNT